METQIRDRQISPPHERRNRNARRTSFLLGAGTCTGMLRRRIRNPSAFSSAVHAKTKLKTERCRKLPKTPKLCPLCIFKTRVSYGESERPDQSANPWNHLSQIPQNASLPCFAPLSTGIAARERLCLSFFWSGRTPGTTYPRFPRTPPCPALHRCRPASPRENDCACPFSGAGDARRGGLPIASERLPRRKSGQGRRSKGSCGLPGALSKLLGRRSRSLHMRRGPKQTPRCSPGR